MSGPGAAPPAGRGLLAYLGFTALVCGALIMVLEVLGSRVVGPFFGVSLFVWTSLISVTLIALAAGYAVGGAIADRRATPDWLYGIILIAGLLTLLIPLVKGPVLEASVPMGLRTGAFVSTLLIFGPALFALGCVAPYVVKLAARQAETLGRTVGSFYAVSTVGSVLGTVLTGFVFIAFLGIDRIFALTAGLLIALAAGYFALFRRRLAPLALLALPLLGGGAPAPTALTMPDGTRVEQVAARESYYGTVKVIDYSFGALRTREMTIDGLVQGGVDTASGLPIYEYAYFMEQLPVALHPDGARCLMIGLGAGLVPSWYQARGVRTDVVEIDPVVVAMARDHFGLRVGGTLHLADARYFLQSTTERYDYVLIDVFNGDTTPGHLLSVEALGLARARLAPRGVLAINFVGSLRGSPFVTASVVRTLQAVFEQVSVHPTFDPAAGDGAGNMVLIAYDGAARPLRLPPPGSFPVHPLAADGVHAHLDRRFEFPPGTPAIVLTDDYNPVDFYDLWLKEKVRRNILRTTDWSLLAAADRPAHRIP